MVSLHTQSYVSQNLMFKFLLKTNGTQKCTLKHLQQLQQSNPYLLISGQCLITGKGNIACLISNVQTDCLCKETPKPDVQLTLFQSCCFFFLSGLLFQDPCSICLHSLLDYSFDVLELGGFHNLANMFRLLKLFLETVCVLFKPSELLK